LIFAAVLLAIFDFVKAIMRNNHRQEQSDTKDE